MRKNAGYLVLAASLLIAPAYGEIFDSGSDGSDGALDCVALNCPAGCDEFNPCIVFFGLNGATTAIWNTKSPNSGLGVYDPNEWAVVFKFTTINIPAGVTVKFDNHEKGAPVVWLASGAVTIAGTLVLDGAPGTTSENPAYARPGPGGFSGGIGRSSAEAASGGFGPGGGNRSSSSTSLASSGGYGTPGDFDSNAEGGAAYGNPSVTPAVGGSGGAGGTSLRGGGAGGGAIIIASSGEILLHGGISALGGSGADTSGSGAPGAGGGIRLIANQISGTGFVRANGGTEGSASPGGDGRIRLEANLNSLDRANVTPQASESAPTCVFADPSQTPSLRVTTVNNQLVPVDPSATILTNDVTIATTGQVVLQIEARNVPADTQDIFVTVRVVPQFGVQTEYQSNTKLEGSFSVSTTSVMIAFPDTRSEVVLRIDTP